MDPHSGFLVTKAVPPPPPLQAKEDVVRHEPPVLFLLSLSMLGEFLQVCFCTPVWHFRALLQQLLTRGYFCLTFLSGSKVALAHIYLYNFVLFS